MTEAAREIVRQTVVTRTAHSEGAVEVRVKVTYLATRGRGQWPCKAWRKH